MLNTAKVLNHELKQFPDIQKAHSQTCVTLARCRIISCVFQSLRKRLRRSVRFFSFCGAATQRGSWPLHSWGFLDHTQRRTTVGRTPLDEWSARRRSLYLTTHNIHNRQTSMPPVGFELTISAGERPQTYALVRAGSGTSFVRGLVTLMKKALSTVHCFQMSGCTEKSVRAAANFEVKSCQLGIFIN
jgi:hypothetical protein